VERQPAQATYEGPECVQRRQLSITMASDIFQAYVDSYVAEMEQVAASPPATGARAWPPALPFGAKPSPTWRQQGRRRQEALHNNRQAVTFPLADALCPLLAARLFILDVLELEAKGPENAIVAEACPVTSPFLPTWPGFSRPRRRAKRPGSARIWSTVMPCRARTCPPLTACAPDSTRP
jgi:hypothetical protein